jgi:hypothetical protein
MIAMKGRKTGGRDFKPGEGGRPRGSRSPALVALGAIGQDHAEELIRATVRTALGGDMRATEILLRRAWPERKGRPISFELPAMQTAAGLGCTVAAVTRAVAEGELTPDEAQSVASVLELQRRAIETADLERRITALEERNAE